MEKDLVESLKDYVTEQKPFGPTKAEKIANPNLADALFDRENKIYRAFKRNPAIVIGRRGAGKTAFLHSEYTSNKFSFVVEFKEAKDFAGVIKEVHGLLKEPIFPEEVAELWKIMLHAAIFRAIIHSEKAKGWQFPKAKDYLGKIGFQDEGTLEDSLWKLLRIVADQSEKGKVAVIASAIKSFAGVSFDEAYVEVRQFLTENNYNAMLLVDTLEQVPLHVPNVAHAVSGLLTCVGSFNAPRSPFHIRFCIPAELYHSFLEASANSLKDFEDNVKLHWHSSELLSIAARRIQIFMELYHPNVHATLGLVNVENRKGALSVFHSIFPETVQNGIGFSENTLAYILRHTQLLPRQLLNYLNEISAANKRLGGDFNSIKPEAVVKGVLDFEEGVVSEICKAFKGRFPAAYEICARCIPEMPLIFDYGQLQAVFNQVGKKAMGGDDFFDFRSLLIEIGAVGRVIDETDRYFIGMFEYSAPHKLTVSSDSELCLHPIFASVFNFRQPRDRKIKRTVYPYGCDLDCEDRRQID